MFNCVAEDGTITKPVHAPVVDDIPPLVCPNERTRLKVMLFV